MTSGIGRRIRSRLRHTLGLDALVEQISEAKVLAAKQLIQNIASAGVGESLHPFEFKVFSQFGEDGIIQYLIHHLNIPERLRTFVEFGVSDYEEANTRFLLVNNSWRGLVIDGSRENVQHIKQSPAYWRHELTAVSAFVDTDNINRLIGENGFSGEIGLLSIDIDGNDYWVWKAIDVIRPIIVITEYNSLFGPKHAVTVPYDPMFVRRDAHFSNLYWGASIGALNYLAKEKEYACVGSNSAGNNVFFVRRDCLGSLKSLSAEQAYVRSHFREALDQAGNLSFVPWTERLRLIGHLPVHDVRDSQGRTIGDLEDTAAATDAGNPTAAT